MQHGFSKDFFLNSLLENSVESLCHKKRKQKTKQNQKNPPNQTKQNHRKKKKEEKYFALCAVFLQFLLFS